MLTPSAAKDFLLSTMTTFLSLDDSIEIDDGKIEKQSNRIYITCDGMKKSLSEWAWYLGINKNTLYSRIRRGWSVADALYTPVRKKDLETAKEFFSALVN